MNVEHDPKTLFMFWWDTCDFALNTRVVVFAMYSFHNHADIHLRKTGIIISHADN